MHTMSGHYQKIYQLWTTKMSSLHPAPWWEVSIDLAGPLPSNDMMLVVIDDHRRFPEAEIIGSTSAKTMVQKFDSIFSRQGIPETVRTDNGVSSFSKAKWNVSWIQCWKQSELLTLNRRTGNKSCIGFCANIVRHHTPPLQLFLLKPWTTVVSAHSFLNFLLVTHHHSLTPSLKSNKMMN